MLSQRLFREAGPFQVVQKFDQERADLACGEACDSTSQYQSWIISSISTSLAAACSRRVASSGRSTG